MKLQRIDFARELRRGIAAYDQGIGHWWLRQAANASHRRAYSKIAAFVRSSFRRSPGRIVDYACGAGHLLLRLQRQFPDSQLVGYDGSALLLAQARKNLAGSGAISGRRVKLVQALLPDFELPSARADLALYLFPNMVPSSAAGNARAWEQRLNKTDCRVARSLAKQRDTESTRKERNPGHIYTKLLMGRVISLNLRQILKRGGTCIRVEYANVPREQLPQLELLRTGFEEGSLDQRVDGVLLRPWFRILACRYYRSGVIEDVFHQSSDKDDRTGGYFITVLRAL
jgi:SAM-dependent methyltransferase